MISVLGSCNAIYAQFLRYLESIARLIQHISLKVRLTRQPSEDLCIRNQSVETVMHVQGFDLLVDMLSVEPLVVLNAAFCELHRQRCPPSEQLLRECAYVSACLLPPCSKDAENRSGIPVGLG